MGFRCSEPLPEWFIDSNFTNSLNYRMHHVGIEFLDGINNLELMKHPGNTHGRCGAGRDSTKSP